MLRVETAGTIAGRMDGAVALYRSLGFREIAPYDDGVPGALYLEKLMR
jgi:ribosomal protein S18 acetylase RimI-like enzyme